MIKIGINGFGRMGRLAAREIIKNKNYQLAAINHPSINQKDFNKMIKYDSVHGQFHNKIDNELIIHNERDPSKIEWCDSIDVILETTGLFKNEEDFETYNRPKKALTIVSAPSKTLPMFIYGVNHKKYNNEPIISAASCTTTCLAPVIDILDTKFHIKSGLATTIHSVTASQMAVDKYKPNTRTGRSLLNNIIPSSTGAASAIGKVLPLMDGMLNAISVRVPVQNVSVVDLTVELEDFPEVEDIINEIKFQSTQKYEGIVDLDYNELVSSDYIGSPYASIIDANTIMKQGDLYKMLIWYDNEYGYVKNLIRLMNYIV